MGLPRTISEGDLAKALVGLEVPRDPFLEGLIRKKELREQSENMADRLEASGIPSRTKRDPISLVGMVTGKVEELPNYRNCNLIPSVHSRNMRNMHRSVDYFISTVPKKSHLRMEVISGGWIDLEDYRKNHKAHTRKMSKWAAHRKLKEWGIMPVFYNVENTIHRDSNGRAMLNMHSHVLVYCTRYIGQKKWAEYLEFTRTFFPKGYLHDSAIQKAAEVVKYCFKPSEFEILSNAEFGSLARQIMGGTERIDPNTGEVTKEGALKFFIPLGALRKQRRELKGQKLVKIPVGDTWQWRITEKHRPDPKPEAGTSKGKNIVLAITAPIPVFTPRREPCIIVQGYTGDFEAMVRQAGLSETVERMKALSAEKQASYMKHTTTPDVPDNPAQFYSPPDHPPPDEMLGCIQ
jgi:hypothetical protein